jgi:hypothetical protein
MIKKIYYNGIDWKFDWYFYLISEKKLFIEKIWKKKYEHKKK